MISYLEYNRSDYYYTYIVIPFDWDAMEIDYTSGSVKCNYIQNMIYKLENNNNNKYSAGTYFIDFSNSVRFGYIDKKSKEFIIEEVPN